MLSFWCGQFLIVNFETYHPRFSLQKGKILRILIWQNFFLLSHTIIWVQLFMVSTPLWITLAQCYFQNEHSAPYKLHKFPTTMQMFTVNKAITSHKLLVQNSKNVIRKSNKICTIIKINLSTIFSKYSHRNERKNRSNNQHLSFLQGPMFFRPFSHSSSSRDLHSSLPQPMPP